VKRLGITVVAVSACLLFASTATAGAAARRIEAPAPGWFPLPLGAAQLHHVEGTLRHRSALRAARLRAEYWGGGRTASDGETVYVFASGSYPDDAANEAAVQTIADFIAGLPHGPELARLNAFVVTPEELVYECGDDALACYGAEDLGGGALVIPGTWPAGFPGQEVLTHEYGHHIAANRDNSPWPAIDWGPKSWATAMGICTRVTAGTAYPGDEGDHYTFNPGEAWAESYRVAAWNGRAQLPLVVDPSFTPSAEALAAALVDVRTPWAAPAPTTITGSFAAPKAVAKPAKKATKKKPKKKKHRFAAPLPAQTFTVATPLDGVLNVTTESAPPGTSVEVVDATTHTVLSPPNIGATVTICGTRSIQIVVRATVPGAFRLTVAGT
jgi:hypothetical protein